MTRFGYTLTILLGASVGVAACSDNIETPTPDDDSQVPGSTTGDGSTTFDHENTDVWDLLKRITEEGPSTFTSQMHSCRKLPYATLGNVLKSLGVANIGVANPPPNTAASLYASGGAAMGTPNYAARVRESMLITTSQASRLFDIFASAAPEIIAKLPTLPQCQVAGVGPELFDASNACHAEGITCLIGSPASPAHVAICTQTVSSASTTDVGKRMAVATMLAAAFTCE
jgi:hypothetical protein